MKHLQDYIIEQAQVNEGASSKSITFDFTGLENGKETIDSLKDMEGVTIEDKTVTLEITPDNVDKIARAPFGPSPLTLISDSKVSRTSLELKPNNSIASSLT